MPPPLGPQFLHPRHLRLVEAPAPALSPSEQHAVDVAWDRSLARQPNLFDGPVVTCLNLEPHGPDLLLLWARTTYRMRALRSIPGHAGWIPASVFVTVLQPTEHGLVLGRESSSSANPGRWHLPGGSAEPPPAGTLLDLAALRDHAAQELVEELGVTVQSQALALWGLSRGEHGNIGIHFQAPVTKAAAVLRRYEALACAERARSIEPELDRLAVIRSPGDLDRLGPHADYLPTLVGCYARGHPTSTQESPPRFLTDRTTDACEAE